EELYPLCYNFLRIQLNKNNNKNSKNICICNSASLVLDWDGFSTCKTIKGERTEIL
ncbi:hypothetical protein GIB67_042477, partial [Kingdonia uniflora]